LSKGSDLFCERCVHRTQMQQLIFSAQ